MAADAAERGRLQAGVAEIAGAFLLDLFEFRDRIGGAVLLVLYRRQVRASSSKVGRKLQGPPKQILRIAKAADPRGQLSHHSDCGDVGRAPLQIEPENALRRRQVVVEQCLAGPEQFRIAAGLCHAPLEILLSDALNRGHLKRLGEGGRAGKPPANVLSAGQGEEQMTSKRPFTLIAAVIFLLMAALHAYRQFTHFQVVIGTHSISQGISLVAIVVTLVLSFGLFREARR
jgi:hypothetical protein